jgi:hypothetical protein
MRQEQPPVYSSQSININSSESRVNTDLIVLSDVQHHLSSLIQTLLSFDFGADSADVLAFFLPEFQQDEITDVELDEVEQEMKSMIEECGENALSEMAKGLDLEDQFDALIAA